MKQATAPRTQEERTEEAKARLRQAALALFAIDGYEATTLAAISLKAGFSRTLAQYHYSEKADIAVELLRERIVRDNHLELLDCPDDAPAPVAWAALMNHLNAVIAYYGDLHGVDHSTTLRGEMALLAGALMSRDERISTIANELTSDLVFRIERLLELCQVQGFIADTTDTHAVAVFHVHAIWGLAQALFANPRGARSVKAALGQMTVLLESLRTRAGQGGEAS